MNNSNPITTSRISSSEIIHLMEHRDPQYRLIDMKQITLLIGMTDKWVYSLIKQSQFPTPIKLGRSSRWRLSDIEAWIDSKSQC